MANWVTFVVVPEDGVHEVYESRFGAVGLDLDLLAGPDVVLPLIRARDQVQGQWRDDDHCEAAALFDLRRETLLLFAGEGPITQMRHRAATLDALRRAWPGWELRWTYDGPADLRTYVGLDPEDVRRDRSPYQDSAVELDDEELAHPDPMIRVVTIGAHRCHLLSGIPDHPIAEGPALLDRLADAPDHGGCAVPADSGIHVDPERRRVGWWLLHAEAGGPDEMAARWPGWTVEFWADRWEEHIRAAGGLFAPPAVDPERALAELRDEAREHWSLRSPDPLRGWMQDAAPDTADAVLGRDGWLEVR